MIVKIQGDNLRDKHIIEAARFYWRPGGDILECYSALGLMQSSTNIKLHHGDRIFFMNDAGQTVDSKRIQLKDEE